MPESAMHANEEQYHWELDSWDEHREARIRVRTLVSAGRTASSGISFGVFELPPGAVLDPHHHHPQEVYYVVGGHAEVLLDGEWRPLRKGDVVYVPGDASRRSQPR